MVTMRKAFITLSLGTLLLVGCGSKKEVTTAAFHNYPTECLGKSMDGTQTLKVWASGTDKSDAIEEAKKKAVYEVTFTGITAGMGDCSAYPVVDDPTARTKHQAYFDKFFSDGSKYKKYVSLKGQPKDSKEELKGAGTTMYSIIVVVDRSELRKRFVKDKILKE
jgi:uncharacterized lipoprotein NlpE involved in copper resistance